MFLEFARDKGVLSKDGEILTEQPHVLQRWAEFYKMYECDDASVSSNSETLSLDIANGEISIKEIDNTIRSLKCGKAAGADDVTAEIIKYGGPRILDLLWLLCNLCWKSGVPDDWRIAVIVFLYKASQIVCANHRAISLISLGSKVYAKILPRRIQEGPERLLWEA